MSEIRLGEGYFEEEPTAVVAKETSCIVIQLLISNIFPSSQLWKQKYHHESKIPFDWIVYIVVSD